MVPLASRIFIVTPLEFRLKNLKRILTMGKPNL